MSGDSRGRPLLNVRCGVCRDWLYEIDGEGATMCIPCRRAYEAGRLAAARADVADFVGWCEREAAKHDGDADVWSVGWQYRSEAQWARGKADGFRAKAADCRRWLEVTS